MSKTEWIEVRSFEWRVSTDDAVPLCRLLSDAVSMQWNILKTNTWFQIPKDLVLENLRVRSWLKSFSRRGASTESEITQLYWQIVSESNVCDTVV